MQDNVLPNAKIVKGTGALCIEHHAYTDLTPFHGNKRNKLRCLFIDYGSLVNFTQVFCSVMWNEFTLP